VGLFSHTRSFGNKAVCVGLFSCLFEAPVRGGLFWKRAISLGKCVGSSFPSYNLLGRELVAWGFFPMYEAHVYKDPVWE